MDASFRSLGLALALALPLAAQAETTLVAVDGRFTLRPSSDDYYTDTLGVFGQAGRRVAFSEYEGRLVPGTGWLTHEAGNEYIQRRTFLTGDYLFDYSLKDYDSGETLWNNRVLLRITSETDSSTGYYRDNSAYVRGDDPYDSQWVSGFESRDRHKFHEEYFLFDAHQVAPDRIALTYGGSTILSHHIPAGFEFRPYDPMDPPWHNASFQGVVVLAAPVPEPETYALMAAGLAGIALSRRLKRRLPV